MSEARMKGYVGEACPECGNFSRVRNGTCLKCDTCGGTTGCSWGAILQYGSERCECGPIQRDGELFVSSVATTIGSLLEWTANFWVRIIARRPLPTMFTIARPVAAFGMLSARWRDLRSFLNGILYAAQDNPPPWVSTQAMIR